MNSYAPVTCKFISAVWRRIVLVRIAESIAIAIAVSSVLGLALTPMLWWRGESALRPALAMLLMGAVSGLVWGISRRPTRFQAAAIADRQLNLHDLLGTVYLLNRGNAASDPWTDAIAAAGDIRCAALRPGDVVVNRLGLRAWGGVGILGALLITMGLFTARPINVIAEASSAESNSPVLPQSAQHSPAVVDRAADSPARPPGTGGVDDTSSRGAEQDQPDDSHPDSATESKDGRNPAAAGSSSSIGGGAALTHPSQSTPTLPEMDDARTALSYSGKAAGGDGKADSHAQKSGDSSASAAAEVTSHRSPPWTSDDWPHDAAAAQAAIGSGRVPDEDADLVRDYFRRD